MGGPQYLPSEIMDIKRSYLLLAKKLKPKIETSTPYAISQQLSSQIYRDNEPIPKATLRRWLKIYRDSEGIFQFDKIDKFLEDLDREEEVMTTKYQRLELQEKNDDCNYHDKPYIFDGEYYYIPISRRKTPLKITKAYYKKMRNLYSQWDGENTTINQLCRQMGISRTLFTEIKTKLGFTKDSPPFTDEEIDERDEDDLVNDLKMKKEGRIEKIWQNESYRIDKRDAKKYHKLMEGKINPLKELLSDVSTFEDVPTLKLSSAENPYCPVILLNDVHVGAFGDKELTGEDYNLDICRERVKTLGEELVYKFNKFGTPDKLIINTGADFFHIDNVKDGGGTSYGTKMDVSSDPRNIGIMGFRIAREFVELMRQLNTNIELIVVEGNHDSLLSNLLGEYLCSMYEDMDQITVKNPLTLREYSTYGKNLLGFGHNFREKESDLGKIMANEAADLWEKDQYKYFMVGHKHSLQIKDGDASGVMVIRASSPAGTDPYHYKEGYIGAFKAINSFLFYENGGLPDNLNATC